eukprot:3534234-Rhodomonas_salina.1
MLGLEAGTLQLKLCLNQGWGSSRPDPLRSQLQPVNESTLKAVFELSNRDTLVLGESCALTSALLDHS